VAEYLDLISVYWR